MTGPGTLPVCGRITRRKRVLRGAINKLVLGLSAGRNLWLIGVRAIGAATFCGSILLLPGPAFLSVSSIFVGFFIDQHRRVSTLESPAQTKPVPLAAFAGSEAASIASSVSILATRAHCLSSLTAGNTELPGSTRNQEASPRRSERVVPDTEGKFYVEFYGRRDSIQWRDEEHDQFNR